MTDPDLAIPPVPKVETPAAQSPSPRVPKLRIPPETIRGVIADHDQDPAVRAEVHGAKWGISAQSVRAILKGRYQILDVPGRGEVAVPLDSKKRPAAEGGAPPAPALPRIGPGAPPQDGGGPGASPAPAPGWFQPGEIYVPGGMPLERRVTLTGCRACTWWGAKTAGDGTTIVMPRDAGVTEAPCNRPVPRLLGLVSRPDGTMTSANGTCDRFLALTLEEAAAALPGRIRGENAA